LTFVLASEIVPTGMKTFGLTGGVGMGKSAAAEILRTFGVPVVDTDELARQLVKPGEPALAEIQQAFGQEITVPDGRLRRDELARIVFADPAAREKLEAILHPRIRAAWLEQIEIWRGHNHPLAAVVIPLLFETRAESFFDKIICVACSAVSQQQRLQARGWDADQIQQRLAAQWPVATKIARADFAVWTEGTVDVHRQQWQQILKKSDVRVRTAVMQR
jgi:dephospho-CoA kinase